MPAGDIVGRQRPDHDASLRRCSNKAPVVSLRRKQQGQVHTRVRGGEGEAAAEQAIEPLDQPQLAGPVEAPHTADVRDERAAEHKLREDHLLDQGGVPVQDGAGIREGVGEIPRHDEVAQPERGQQDFREGAEMKRSAVLCSA